MDQVYAMRGAPGGHKKALAPLQLKRWLGAATRVLGTELGPLQPRVISALSC